MAVLIDNNNQVHVFTGYMRILEDDPATAGYSYFPYTDGIKYWNESFGADSTVIIASPGSANWFETSVLISSIALLGGVTWFCFSYARHIGQVLGNIGIQLISRIMGLILAALAVEYVVKGIQALFDLSK